MLHAMNSGAKVANAAIELKELEPHEVMTHKPADEDLAHLWLLQDAILNKCSLQHRYLRHRVAAHLQLFQFQCQPTVDINGPRNPASLLDDHLYLVRSGSLDWTHHRWTSICLPQNCGFRPCDYSERRYELTPHRTRMICGEFGT